MTSDTADVTLTQIEQDNKLECVVSRATMVLVEESFETQDFFDARLASRVAFLERTLRAWIARGDKSSDEEMAHDAVQLLWDEEAIGMTPLEPRT